MAENVENQSSWLAIASFVLALVGCLFLLIPFISVILWILAIIFGIVALCKKQQAKWASILWIIISILWAAITLIVWLFVGKLIAENKDEFISPITEFSAWVEENPEVAALMEDEEFNEKFQSTLEQRLAEKYGEDYEDIEDLEGIFNIWGDLFEEMKNVATELAAQEGLALENDEEIINEEPVEENMEEVVEEPTEEVVENVVEDTVEEPTEEIIDDITTEEIVDE